MLLLRNKEIKIQILCTVVLSTVGAVIEIIFCPRLFWLPLFICLLIGMMDLYFTIKRYKKLSSFSQDLDRLLHGDNGIHFDEYEEGELSVIQNEISKMTQRLMLQSEQLENDKVFLSNALADISHQLKTPLTSLEIINAALTQENVSPEQRERLLQDELVLLTNMEWMITTLLKLSRLDACAVTFEKDLIELKDLLNDITKSFDVLCDIRHIIIDLSIDSSIFIIGDKKWLYEALSNIVKNSFDNSPKGGTVFIKAEENPMYVRVSITDQGNGIPKDELPHIFERFYCGQKSRKNGTGIGLSLAKTIISHQNGSIQATNMSPYGAQFLICFYKGLA